MSYKKYYIYKEQISFDNGATWQDTGQESPSGDPIGTYETLEECEGIVPPTPTPQYRWVNMDASVDYYCEGTTKYYSQKKQVSYDDGQTWQDVTPPEYQRGSVAEEQSTDCGYVPPGPSPYESQYLTIVPRENGSIRFRITSSNTEYYYSMDSGATWVTGNSATTISTTTGNKVMFKGNLTSVFGGVGSFVSSAGRFNVEGNAMSLLYGDNFNGKKSLAGKGDAFDNLFAFNANVISAENLVLPADTLDELCYNNMFMACTSLTTAPTTLSATTLATNCYDGMFSGCTSLTSPPSLPAMTLADMCYGRMFTDCTALRRTPVLPATTLAHGCYQAMFWGCTNLTTAPSVLPATTLADSCYDGMFYGCTSLTTAPELPATTLVSTCYRQMFSFCTSLNYIKCLATYVSADNCTKNWVVNVSSTGTFVTPSSTNWSSGGSGIPTGWTRVDI